MLKKLNRTRSCELGKIQALVKQAARHLIRPRGNLRMSWYRLPPPLILTPKRKVWFQKWKKYTSSLAGGDGRWSFLWQAPARRSGWINTGLFANSQSAKTSDRHSRRPGWGNIYHLWQRIEKVTSAGQVIKVTSVRSCHISLWRLQLWSPQAPIHKLLDESVG